MLSDGIMIMYLPPLPCAMAVSKGAGMVPRLSEMVDTSMYCEASRNRKFGSAGSVVAVGWPSPPSTICSLRDLRVRSHGTSTEEFRPSRAAQQPPQVLLSAEHTWEPDQRGAQQ